MVLLKIFTALLFTFSSAYYVWQLQLNGYFWKRSIKKLVFALHFVERDTERGTNGGIDFCT